MATVVTLIKTVVWHDKGSESVKWGSLNDSESWFQKQGAEYRKERLVIFKEEDVWGLETVTTDEDRVVRGGWTEIKWQR